MSSRYVPSRATSNTSRNFLYDIERRQGVLVDFGLAEVIYFHTSIQAVITYSLGSSAKELIAPTVSVKTAIKADVSKSNLAKLSANLPPLATLEPIKDLPAVPIERVQEGSGPQKYSSNAQLKQPKSIYGPLALSSLPSYASDFPSSTRQMT